MKSEVTVGKKDVWMVPYFYYGVRIFLVAFFIIAALIQKGYIVF